jgi:transcription initiation factor TFIIH subunit 1
LLKIDYLEPGSSSNSSIVFLFKAFEFREKLIQLIAPVVKKDDKSSQDEASKASSKNPEDSVPKPDISRMRVDEQSKLISPIEIKIRRALLAKNAPLASLHRELVISGVLSEEEFWENRKNQLDDQLIQLTQPKAQSSGWVDIKAETNEGQGSKYTLTPEIIHSIFLQHPLVQKAYDEHVPANMSEESFWKRYFGSRYFHRNLNASQSGQSTSDELFDKLLEQDDAEAQSAASKFDHNKINRLVDLEASSGDRPDTGNRPDFTMVPGTDSKSLSLIRQFNQHSQQVLRNAKRKRNEEEGLAQEKFYNEATLIEDLTAKKPVLEAPLRIESNSQYSQNHNQSDIEKQLTEQQVILVFTLTFLY